MINQKMRIQRAIKEILLPGLIAVCALGILGSWTYALVLDLKVRRALKVDLPAPAKKAKAAKAAPTVTPVASAPNRPSRPGPSGSLKPPGSQHPPGAPPGGAPMPALPKELEELVKAKALFGRMPDSNVSVQGVLGNSALVNGQWMKLGQPAGNIVVKEIDGNKVVLEVNGQRREMAVWPKMPGT